MQVVIQPFSPKGEGHGTDLGEPLRQAIETIPNLRGVVLASDGDWNEGEPPVLAASRLRMKGMPVFAVPVGSASRLPDVELLSHRRPHLRRRRQGGPRAVHDRERDAPGLRHHRHPQDFRRRRGDQGGQGRADDRTTDEVIWKPKGTGEFTLKLTIPKHADEQLADNNTLSAPIAIREEKLKVLVVESTPRWEYRYLRNALSRDPGIDLSCLLFHPGLSKPGGGNKDYIKAFPKGLDELSKFDVVFLGDVGVENGQLTPEDCTPAQRVGRAPGQRPGLHAGLGRPAVLADGDRAGRPLPGGARLLAAGRLGLADAEPLRADGVGASEPLDQAGRLAGRERPGLGGPAGVPVVRSRSSGPRRGATSSASTRTPRTSRAGCLCS